MSDKEQGPTLLSDLEAERYRTILTTEARAESIEYSIAGSVLGAAEKSGFVPDGADFEARCNQRNEFAGRAIEILTRYAERRGFRADLTQPPVVQQFDAETQIKIDRIRRLQVKRRQDQKQLGAHYVVGSACLNNIDYLLSCIQPATDPQRLTEIRQRHERRWNNASLTADVLDDRDDDIDYLLSVVQPAGELTVESCLKELREMFPAIEGAKYDLLQQHLVISLPDQWLKYFSGASISDCMSQVRSWKQTVERGS